MIYILCNIHSSNHNVDNQTLLSFLYPEYYNAMLIHDKEKNCSLSAPSHELIYNEKESFLVYTFPHEGEDIFLCDVCSSTQNIAKMLYKNSLLNPYAIILTKNQLAGRGQHKHTWLSIEGNIMATLLLPVDVFFMQSITTVFLGAVLTHFLRSLGVEAHNKWINDILLDTKKVAGILLEQEKDCITLGIGLNVQSIPDIVEYDPRYEVTSIMNHYAFPYSPVSCMYAFREFMKLQYYRFVSASFEEKKSYIEEYLAYKNTHITFELYDNSTSLGICHGIGSEGGLILDIDGTCTEYTDGSIVCVQK